MDAPGEESGHEGYGLPRAARITSSVEIRTLFRRGKRKKTRHLDVFISASPVARARLGVVVPKHKRRIVERNLVKRRLRDVGRRFLLPALRVAGMHVDLMVRARPEAYGATFEELRADLAALVEELCSRGR
ncbi:MAG: Ribonuclease protein component [Gemmatimonadetes bacterium]|nr:Ribonuclease protein component [Gemmatimonadota bacterium]